jgi:hypothetical protein
VRQALVAALQFLCVLTGRSRDGVPRDPTSKPQGERVMRSLVRSSIFSAIIVVTTTAALADRKAGDACAAGLSAPSRDIYSNTLASNPTQATARSIVVAETEKLISAGKISMTQARGAAEAAGKCLELVAK